MKAESEVIQRAMRRYIEAGYREGRARLVELRMREAGRQWESKDEWPPAAWPKG